MIDSARTPSRRGPRETPSASPSAFSIGSRSPGLSAPSTIICLMPWTTTSVCDQPDGLLIRPLSLAGEAVVLQRTPMHLGTVTRNGRQHLAGGSPGPSSGSDRPLRDAARIEEFLQSGPSTAPVLFGWGHA